MSNVIPILQLKLALERKLHESKSITNQAYSMDEKLQRLKNRRQGTAHELSKGWIGVDLDGTLAIYDEWKGIEHIGEPIPEMVNRVKEWIESGQQVKIFTARASDEKAIPFIKEWLENNGLPDLEITNVKDFSMIQLWDDRAVQVIENTGTPIEKTNNSQKIDKNGYITFQIECTAKADNIPYLLNILSVLEVFGQQGHTGNLIAGIDGDGNFRPKFSWDKSLFDKNNINYREYPKDESDYEVLEPKVKLVEKKTHSQPDEPQQAERPDPIHFELNGLPISIENQAGTVRKGTDQEGHDWAVQLKAHYGEIRGSMGADGDYVDCFINPDYMPGEQSLDDPVFVVNQHDTYTGEFDEVKVMIGYDDLEQAKAAYAENYEDNFPEQEIIETNYYELTDWLNSHESVEQF